MIPIGTFQGRNLVAHLTKHRSHIDLKLGFLKNCSSGDCRPSPSLPWNCCSMSLGFCWRCLPFGYGGPQRLFLSAAGLLLCNVCWLWDACWSFSSPSFRPRTIYAPCAARWKNRRPANGRSARQATIRLLRGNGKIRRPLSQLQVSRSYVTEAGNRCPQSAWPFRRPRSSNVRPAPLPPLARLSPIVCQKRRSLYLSLRNS